MNYTIGVMMVTNKRLINSLLKCIGELGYTITDRVFGSCYFVFEGNKNSICHFHIKEIPRLYICIVEYR